MNPLRALMRALGFRKPFVGGPSPPSQINVRPGSLIHIRAAAFDRYGERQRPRLIWHSSDTSVVRLQVAGDTLSALARIGNAGTALVTVSDGETCETHRIMIHQPTERQGAVRLELEEQ